MRHGLRRVLSFALGAFAVVFAFQPLELWLGPLLLLPDLASSREERLRRFAAALLGVLAATAFFLALGRATDVAADVPALLYETHDLRARSRYQGLKEKGGMGEAILAGWTRLALRDLAVLIGEGSRAEGDAARTGRAGEGAPPPLSGAALLVVLFLRLAFAGALIERLLRPRLGGRWNIRLAGITWGGLLLWRFSTAEIPFF